MRLGRALLIGGAAVAAVGFAIRLRQPLLNWGATPREVVAAMPGDDLVGQADLVATRAITISAPPESVWPWLRPPRTTSGRLTS